VVAANVSYFPGPRVYRAGRCERGCHVRNTANLLLVRATTHPATLGPAISQFTALRPCPRLAHHQDPRGNLHARDNGHFINIFVGPTTGPGSTSGNGPKVLTSLPTGPSRSRTVKLWRPSGTAAPLRPTHSPTCYPRLTCGRRDVSYFAIGVTVQVGCETRGCSVYEYCKPCLALATNTPGNNSRLRPPRPIGPAGMPDLASPDSHRAHSPKAIRESITPSP